LRNGIERMQARIRELEEFDPLTVQERSDPRVEALERAIDDTLARIFGNGTPDYHRYWSATQIDTASHNFAYPVPHEEIVEGLVRGKEQARALLTTAIKALQEELRFQNGDRPPSVCSGPPAIGQKVFVVHGHDEAAREGMARFLERIELEAVILHEQPDQGLTIIEKFEAYASQVSFAVILLTPDDLGGIRRRHK
jgi:hypothetical protein